MPTKHSISWLPTFHIFVAGMVIWSGILLSLYAVG